MVNIYEHIIPEYHLHSATYILKKYHIPDIVLGTRQPYNYEFNTQSAFLEGVKCCGNKKKQVSREYKDLG